jgi:16S rRNA (cytosine967-C5)-methyltransferase
MARKMRGESIARFINGVLRQIDRRPPTFSTLAEKWAHPQWMVEQFERELTDPTQLEARLQANVTPPPLLLRLHPNAPLEARQAVEESDDRLTVVAPDDYSIVRKGIKANWWLPQDEASARVVHLLAPQPGDRVLEICAGRGVKSSQIATAIGPTGFLLAVDSSAPRLAAAQRLLERWAPDTRHHGVVADATLALPIASTLKFDRILIDAPCSGLGVIRRRPEILTSRKPEDIARNALLQKAILTMAVTWLKPGGALVYAVCTTTAEETTGVTEGYTVVERFESRPERDQMDGFYAAMLAL